jgi:hypothetical protein
MARLMVFFLIMGSRCALRRSRGAWHQDSFTEIPAGRSTLRNMSSKTRARSEYFAALSLREFHSKRLFRSWNDEKVILNSPGLYPITSRSRQKSYVGGTLDLRNRLSTRFADGQPDEWGTGWGAKSIRHLGRPEVTDPIDLLSMQRRLIQSEKPSLNVLGPTAA